MRKLLVITISAIYVIGMLIIEIGIALLPLIVGISKWNLIWSVICAIIVYCLDLMIREGTIKII